MLRYPTILRRAFMPVSILAVILITGLSLMFRAGLFEPAAAAVQPTNQAESMPRLEGDKAREYLEQQGLSESLGAAIAKARYKVSPVESSKTENAQFEAENPANGYQVTFKADGTTELNGIGKKDHWKTSLRLMKLGRGENLETVPPGSWEAAENRVENRRENLIEWFENKSSGLEHGFTINTRPETMTAETGELRVAMKIGGNLSSRLDAGGQTLSLGKQAVTYSKLKVSDAAGKELTSRMELDGKNLVIVVEDSTAVYPVTIDPVFAQVKKLTASDGAANDYFGWSVSISGDTAIVGARGDDRNKGAAYIFERNKSGTNNWGQVKKLTVSDSAENDGFGGSVSISGDTAIVGSPGSDAQKGAAYIFERNTGGTANNWGQVKKLTVSDGTTNSGFGGSVSISGDTAIVGSPGSGAQKGAAYIFERNTGGTANNWGLVKKLTVSDGTTNSGFGGSVSISGDTVIVGALTDNAPNTNQGSAYIFERNTDGMANNWGEVKKLTASDGAARDQFGISVSISGDTAIVGALGNNSSKGAAYIFERNTGGTANNWGEVKKLTASDGVSNDQFGISVSISGDSAIVGAYFDDIFKGSAYIFERNMGGTVNNWGQVKKLTASDGSPNELFGNSVSISGDTVIIGAPFDSSPNNNQGSAYIFASTPVDWVEIKKPVAPDGVSNDQFGISVSISGDTAIVGANQDDSSKGAAYIFERNAGGTTNNWGLVKKLTASNGSEDDQFGISVSISGDTAIIGANFVDAPTFINQGAAYIFERNTGGADNWGQVKKLTPSNFISNNQFGYSVSISDDTVIVGAYFDNSSKGAAYVFERNTGGADNWGLVKKLTGSNGASNGQFGISVSISGDTAIVGANFDSIPTRSGSAYIFERNTGGADNWGQVKKIIVPNGLVNDQFGTSVSISGDTGIVGAIGPSSAAYIYERNAGGTNNWGQVQILYSFTTRTDGGGFGQSVSISGDTAIVGASRDDTSNIGQGAAYIFERNTGGADNWGQVKKLTASDGIGGDQFGGSVSISDDTIIVGAFLDDIESNNNQGSTYIFNAVLTSADLSITKTDSPDPVTAGTNLTYTVTITNNGPDAAANASWSDTLPAGTTFVSLPAVAGWSCTTPAVGAGGTISCTNPLFAASSAVFTLTASVAPSVASGTILSNTAATTSATTDPTPGNNTATAMTTVTAAADLMITKTDGVTTATPGGSVTYTITASNRGPSNVTGATVADTFPSALTATWTCVGTGGGSCTASGSGNINNTVNLPSGGSVTYTVSATISASATGMLTNTATVTAPAGVTDPTPGNNSATDTDTLSPQADLSITKTDGVTTATPGGSITYTITASNSGPSNVTGATVTDTFPAILTATWTCVGTGGGTCTAAGSGNINNTVNLPSGGSVIYTVSAAISAAATGTLSNTATVTAPAGVTDPTPGNNSATDTDTLSPQADLAITKTDGATTATPGGTITYTITASNAGPSNVTGATVADTFPSGLTGVTWTCAGAGGGSCTASGSGNINNTVNLPAGGSVTYTIIAAVSASATGTLSNTATVTAPAGVIDPTPGNNSATDTDTVAPQADLAITKTDGVTSVTVGGTLTYTITASNAGPSNAPGAIVADTFPSGLTGITWTCTGASGGTCTASGGGNINDTVNLPVGGKVTYTVNAVVSPAALGTLSNTASVSAPSGVTDPNPGNNSATDADTIISNADLSVTKSDGPDPVTAGNNIAYTITVSNAGPAPATSAVLTDVIPENTTYQSITAPMGWTCTIPAVNSGGTVSCRNSALANGAAGTFVLIVNVNTGTANGTITNTAAVSSANPDPAAGNNLATATTTVAEFISPAPTGQAPKAMLVKPAAGNTTAGGGASDSSCAAPSGVMISGMFANINQALGAANIGDTIYVCPKYTANLVVPYIEQVSLGFTNLSVVGISDAKGSRAVIAANPSTLASPTTQMGTNYVVQIAATGVNFGNFVVDGAPGGANFANTGIFNGIVVRRSGAFVFNNTVQNIRTADTAANSDGQSIAILGAGTAGSPLEAGTTANPVNILNNVLQTYRSNGVSISAGSSSAYAFVRGNYIIGNGAAAGTVNQSGVQFLSGAIGDVFNNRITAILDNNAGCSTTAFNNCSAGIRLNTTAGTSTNNLRIRFNQINNTQTGIFAQDVQYVSMTSNTISHSVADGINLRGSALNLGSNFNTINQNTIFASRRAGIFIGLAGGDASLGNNLTMNTIEDAFTGIANNPPAGNNTIPASGTTANTFISVNNFVGNAASGANNIQNTNPLP